MRWLVAGIISLLLAGGIYLYLLRHADQDESGTEIRVSQSPNEDRHQSNVTTGVLGQDGIPSIDDPVFSSGDWLLDQDLVIGIELEGESRAYMLALLSRHEIVNDMFGDRPVAVTWCPLCFTAIVFDASVSGQDLTFGVSGQLRNSNLVMYDRETGSNWSQALGRALDGPLEGSTLSVLPSIVGTWGDWKTQHPETVALDPPGGPERPIDPYLNYYETDQAGLSWIPEAYDDNRLGPKDLVFGIELANSSRAYPLRSNQTLILNDELGGEEIVVILQDRTRAQAFGRPAGTDFDEVVGDLLISTSGTRYSVFDGHSLDDGEDLVPIRGQISFWFSWKDHYPETSLYLDSGEIQSEEPPVLESTFARTTLIMLVALGGGLGVAELMTPRQDQVEEE